MSYRSSTYQHDLEASRVVIGHSKTFNDGSYAVVNSVDSKTVNAKLGFDLLRAFQSKTRSVRAGQSGISKRLRTVILNDERSSFVVTQERTTWLAHVSTTTPTRTSRLERCDYNHEERSKAQSNSRNRRHDLMASYFETKVIADNTRQLAVRYR